MTILKGSPSNCSLVLNLSLTPRQLPSAGAAAGVSQWANKISPQKLDNRSNVFSSTFIENRDHRKKLIYVQILLS